MKRNLRAVPQHQFSQIDTVPERVGFRFHPPGQETDFLDSHPSREGPAADQADIFGDHRLPHASGTVQEHVVHHYHGRELPLALHPGGLVEGSCADVFHRFRNGHLLQHQTVPEDFRLNPPDSLRNLYHAPKPPVAAEVFLPVYVKTAEGAAKNQPHGLRQLL